MIRWLTQHWHLKFLSIYIFLWAPLRIWRQREFKLWKKFNDLLLPAAHVYLRFTMAMGFGNWNSPFLKWVFSKQVLVKMYYYIRRFEIYFLPMNLPCPVVWTMLVAEDKCLEVKTKPFLSFVAKASASAVGWRSRLVPPLKLRRHADGARSPLSRPYVCHWKEKRFELT